MAHGRGQHNKQHRDQGRPAKSWGSEAVKQRNQARVRDDDCEQEHHPGQHARDDEADVSS